MTLLVLLSPVAAVSIAHAFLDELASLKAELQVYQTTHAADFTDVVQKLDDIGGVTFTDVSEADWFHSYVAAAAGWGIISGYTDPQGKPTGEFGPSKAVTVAESLKMAFRAARVDETACLRPVVDEQARGHWAERYVSCAEERQMRFFETAQLPDLNRPVTRAELLTVIHDAFGDHVPPLYAEFTDTVGHKYEADIAYAVARGMVSGDRDDLGNPLGVFRPDAAVNRAEAAKILYARLRVLVAANTAQ